MICEAMPKSRRDGKRKGDEKDLVKLPHLSAAPCSLAFPSLVVSLASTPSTCNPPPLPPSFTTSTPNFFSASCTSVSSNRSWMEGKKEKWEEENGTVETKEEGATLQEIPSARRQSSLSFLGRRNSGRASTRSPSSPSAHLVSVFATPPPTSSRKEPSESKEESEELQLPPSASMRGLPPRQPLFNSSLSSSTAVVNSPSFLKVHSYHDDTLSFDVQALVQEEEKLPQEEKKVKEESAIKKKRNYRMEKMEGIKEKHDNVEEEERTHVTNTSLASEKNADHVKVPLPREGAATRADPSKRPPKPVPKGASKGKSSKSRAPVEAALEVRALRPLSAPGWRSSEETQQKFFPTPPTSTTAAQSVWRGRQNEADEEVKKRLSQLDQKKSSLSLPHVEPQEEVPDEPSFHSGSSMNDDRRRSEMGEFRTFPLRESIPQEGSGRSSTTAGGGGALQKSTPPSRPPLSYDTGKRKGSAVLSSLPLPVALLRGEESDTLWDEQVRHSTDGWSKEGNEEDVRKEEGKLKRKLSKVETIEKDDEKKKRSALTPPFLSRPPLCSRGSSPSLMKSELVEESSRTLSTDPTIHSVTQEEAATVKGRKGEEDHSMLFAFSPSISSNDFIPVRDETSRRSSALKEQENEKGGDSDKSNEREEVPLDERRAPTQDGGNAGEEAENDRGDRKQDKGEDDLVMPLRMANKAEIVGEEEGTKNVMIDVVVEAVEEEEGKMTEASPLSPPASSAPLSSSSQAFCSSTAPFRRRVRQRVADYRGPQAPVFAIMRGSWSDEDVSGTEEQEEGEEEEDNAEAEVSAIIQQMTLIKNKKCDENASEANEEAP